MAVNDNTYFPRRILSFLIDIFIISIIGTLMFIIFLAVSILLMVGFEIYSEDLVNISMLFIYIIVMIINVLYFTIPITKISSTIGQRLVGLKLLHNNQNTIPAKNAILRYIGLIVSIYTFYIGYIIALFTKNNKSIIDYISNTTVVDNKK